MYTRADWQSKRRTVQRIFLLMPILVFLLTLILFVQNADTMSSALFAGILMRALAASLASGVVCVAAYNFYKYLLERSPGL